MLLLKHVKQLFDPFYIVLPILQVKFFEIYKNQGSSIGQVQHTLPG